MSIANLTNFFKYIGKNNKPIYPVMMVATAEIIFRPLFTMLDQKSPKETKQYTALREAMTELVAVPTYWACGVLASKGGKLFKDEKVAQRAGHNLMNLGVWTAALLVIPGLCSLFVKPFTQKIFNRKKQQNYANDNIVKPSEEFLQKPNPTDKKYYIAKPFYNTNITGFTNTGMRV